MLHGMNSNKVNLNDYHQRVADRNIQSLEDRQEEIEQAKNGFIGMLAGIFVGAMVGWIFLAPRESEKVEPEIPVIRRSIKPFKIQPNDPGGMEIDNQDREIYHIVDNTQKEIKDVNIRPLPDMPKLVVENTISTPENMESLVESIEDNMELQDETIDTQPSENNVKLAQTELLSIDTNSREKIVIPQKNPETFKRFRDLVRLTGVEPVRPSGHKHLKLASLPIPAQPQKAIFTNR